MPNLKTTAAAAAILALSVGAAAAEPAYTSADLNMRSGPGVNNSVVGVIPRDAEVEVMGCQGSWCQVEYRGTMGFASRSYLDMDSGMTGQMSAPMMGAPAARGPVADPFYDDDDELFATDPFFDDDDDYGPGW